jgi:hypothetical protein
LNTDVTRNISMLAEGLNMKKSFAAVVILILCAAVSLPQKGTAEPDYYPMGYSGSTWTGEVTSIDEAAREFTLTYKKGDKEQTFVGVLPKGYTVKMKDGTDYEVKMADLMGMQLKAYYTTKEKKDADGVNQKTNEVFKIKFLPKPK